MTRSEAHFDEFKPHTRLKHLVLQTYLKAWARKLLLRKGAGKTVYYVDACAGRGTDDVGNHGSPVLAAREAAAVELQLRDDLRRDVRVRVIAIEKKVANYKALAANLAAYQQHARAVLGTLEEHFQALASEMAAEPALFFIDPFGLEPLKADLVYRALARPQTEVFLLFAEQAALRHYGVITADDADAGNHREQFGLQLDFDSVAEQQREKQLMAERDARTEELAPTRERCELIMDDAFGGQHWRTAVDRAKPSERRDVLLGLYKDLLHDAGARYVLRIPIRASARRHVYHLFHATKSSHGYVTMKEAVDAALKKAPLQGATADAIRFLIRSDLRAIEDRVRDFFAGERAHWTSDDDSRRSIRSFVLEETEAYPSQLQELKERLDGLRDRKSRKLIYQFPDRTRR